MRFSQRYVLALVSSFVTGIFGLSPLAERDTSSLVDTCGNVDAILKVPNLFLKGQFITLGLIDACLCVSSLPIFVATNPLAITAAALVGRAEAITILTDMISSCNDQKKCQYPSQSIPTCKKGSPCFFTCKDGYTASPAGSYPTQCVCPKPYVECNGKCIRGACPSGYYFKRDLFDARCPQGVTACGTLGRNARAWECVDTMNDLESCGGCMISLDSINSSVLGVDCTSLPGISDVSCVKGACLVRRCMPGFDIHESGSSCVHSQGKDIITLAAQYGLEHFPL